MNREEYEKQLFDKIISSMERHGLAKIAESVILTGSFGRGEPTYTETQDGVVLKSDVEIAIVFSGSKKAVNQLIADVSSEFSEDLNLMPIKLKRILRIQNFNGSILSPKKKTIFTYDLYKGSKTIWGKDLINQISLDLSEVDLYEAKRIVANRIGELIYIAKENPQNEPIWKAKLLLAIASAYLLLSGQYQSSYRAQRRIMFEDENRVKTILGEDFLLIYDQAFSFLRENGSLINFSDEELRKAVGQINRLFSQYGLSKPKVNSLSRWIKYLIKYIRFRKPIGLANFENKILDGLIFEYINQDVHIEKMADLWHQVLY